MMVNRCDMCNIEFESRRDARFCSPRCRVTFSRRNVTDNPNVTVNEPQPVTDNFEFKTKNYRSPSGFHVDDNGKDIVRVGKYWYDIPLGAIPVLKDGWPEMPDFMNGREYFLWWKNEFGMEGDKPQILNPFPVYENVKYEMGGEQSRRWGA